MSNNHAASILEILSVTSEEKTGKSGKKFTIAKMNCSIFQDDGEVAVGTHDMFLEGHDIKPADMPRAGFYYPRYEPRARWDSPSFSGVIVEMVPVDRALISKMLADRYGAITSPQKTGQGSPA